MLINSPSHLTTGREASADAASAHGDMSEQVLSYVLSAKRVHSELRRLIGQVAGLLILANGTKKATPRDGSIRVGARSAWLEAKDQLKRLSPSSRLRTHLLHLFNAHALIGICLDALEAKQPLAEQVPQKATMQALADSYEQLQSASLPRFGITMVDLNHACCSHGCSHVVSEQEE
jgi:hypothetical protein